MVQDVPERPDPLYEHSDSELQAQMLMLPGVRPGEPRGFDVRVAVDQSGPVEVLARVGREKDAPLIVTGWGGRNELATAVLGWVTSALVATASSPIGVVSVSAGDPMSAR